MRPVVMLVASALLLLACPVEEASAQSPRMRVSAMGGPSLMGVDMELRLTDRVVLEGGPSVHTEFTQVGFSTRVGVDMYLAGQPFSGLFVRVEAAAVLTIESDTSERDVGMLGSILLGSTWTASSGFSTGLNIGGKAFYIPGKVQRVQLDITLRLSIGYTF